MNMFGGNMLGDFELDDAFDAPPNSLRLGAGSKEDSDDGPWPTGQSPDREALDLPREKLEALAGFPHAPGAALLDAFYFLAVRTAVQGLGPRQLVAEEKLARFERVRDDKLGEIAEMFRARLSKEPRFGQLYADLASKEREVASRRADLAAADQGLGEQLRALEVRLADARERAARQVQVALDTEKLAQTLERNLSRAKGLQSRLQIEMRNVARLAEERAPGSSHMPPELGQRYSELEAEYARAATDAANIEKDYRIARTRETEARDGLRRLEAESGRILAERDSWLARHESRNAALVEAIQAAEEEARQKRADTGRALLRLRSEVPVERAVRTSLFEREEAVKLATVEAESLKRAARAYDAESYQRGRTLLFAFVGLIVVVLGWAVFH
jgi:hypothetical protein